MPDTLLQDQRRESVTMAFNKISGSGVRCERGSASSLVYTNVHQTGGYADEQEGLFQSSQDQMREQVERFAGAEEMVPELGH